MTGTTMPTYFRTDTSEEAVSALEMFAESLGDVAGDPYRWKWSIIALHGAVQGFLVLGLRGSNNFDVLSPRSAEIWAAAVNEGNLPPADGRLDSLLGLYAKAKSDRMLKYTTSKRLEPRGTQGASVKMLNSLRNDFIHFVPKRWSIEVTGLPLMCGDCLDLIEFLGWESGNVMWVDDGVQKRARRAVADARRQILSLRS
jgi:hypothetical protein